MVAACWRGEPGTGSPTVVVDDAGLSDEERARVPGDTGVSHAVFADRSGPVVRLRFFTAAGELPACGHGTLAACVALEAWEHRAGRDTDEWRFAAGGREFSGGMTPEGAWFSAGVVRHRVPADAGPVLDALGAVPAGPVYAAGTARERLLVPVAPDALGPLAPDAGVLAAACDAAGLLGCFVYAPSRARWFDARMFAPSIGVPEDAANANSVAALAGVLAQDGPLRLVVSMGGSLGSPSRIRAEGFPAGDGSARVRLSARMGPARDLVSGFSVRGRTSRGRRGARSRRG
ncbi:Predicted epimerase YddE/YHI9, PhzF superfamily [Glycomyces sambucus]|uniref:Predicted epimerase YddE/YHI9, PhzF superfamily n=1 Tax=Glycomyces sambucus TaxID=380244 RepID=A0A1G9FAD6_9ACTN|nr:Predicted epimerase YddE/YHI9, PhzF superfamily [Glycomyces sambucus]